MPFPSWNSGHNIYNYEMTKIYSAISWITSMAPLCSRQQSRNRSLQSRAINVLAGSSLVCSHRRSGNRRLNNIWLVLRAVSRAMHVLPSGNKPSEMRSWHSALRICHRFSKGAASRLAPSGVKRRDNTNSEHRGTLQEDLRSGVSTQRGDY